MLVSYSLLCGISLFMIYHDIRKQTIPLWSLLIFMMAALLKQIYEPDSQGLWAAGAIALLMSMCQGFFYIFKHAHTIGMGDLVLGPLCGLWLRLHELPNFFIATGIVALLFSFYWWRRWAMHTFPLAPAILTGLAFIFLIRCFSSGNGI